MTSFASGTRRAIGVDEWVDHTHATTYEAFVAAVEVVTKNTWGLAGQGAALPVMQRMGQEVDLTEVVKYEDVMWSLTLHCDSRSSSYDDHGRDSENSQANTVQWKDPSLRHLTPTMLSLLEAPQTVLQSDLSHRCHSVQRLFGVKDFIMLNPPAISNSIFIPHPFPSFSCMELHLLFTTSAVHSLYLQLLVQFQIILVLLFLRNTVGGR